MIFRDKKVLPTLLTIYSILILGIALVLIYLKISKTPTDSKEVALLIMEVIGTVLLFFFAFPSPIEPESHNLVLESYDKKKVVEAKIINTFHSGVGLVLLLIAIYSRLNG